MKKTFLFIAAISLIFISADAKTKNPKKVIETVPVNVLTNNVDSMSYALGLNVGSDFVKNIKGIPGGKYTIDLIIKGFSIAMKGDSALMTSEFANEYFRNFISEAQKTETAAKKVEGEKFLAENKTKEGVITTPSGLQYQVLVAADGPKPKATDSVKVDYEGFLINGTKFDSSVDRGKPIVFPLNQVIPGWTEGVQLMSVGSKYKFFVPYDLGYGEKGAGNGAIPGFATLIFEVNLLGIIPTVEATPPLDAKPMVDKKAAPSSPKRTKKTK